MTQAGPMRAFPGTFGGITKKETPFLWGWLKHKDETTILPSHGKSLPKNITTLRQAEQEVEKDRNLLKHLEPTVPEANYTGQ